MASLREDFKDHVSRSAFQSIDGDLALVGKWGRVIKMDDIYDCWFIGPNLTPLSSRRINAIAENLPVEGGFRKLTGEGWVQVRGKAEVLAMLPLLGIKKKRVLSEESRRTLASRMAGLQTCTA